MARRSTAPPRPPAAPPATTAEAAAFVRDYAVKLYDRQDGQGVNWRVIADSLFKAAFDVLDRLPDEACRSVAGRVHEGSYSRMAEGPKTGASAAKGRVESALLQTNGYEGTRPKPS